MNLDNRGRKPQKRTYGIFGIHSLIGILKGEIIMYIDNIPITIDNNWNNDKFIIKTFNKGYIGKQNDNT